MPADQLEQYAATTAAEGQMQIYLVLHRRESAWLDEEGSFSFRQMASPDEPLHFPYMIV